MNSGEKRKRIFYLVPYNFYLTNIAFICLPHLSLACSLWFFLFLNLWMDLRSIKSFSYILCGKKNKDNISIEKTKTKRKLVKRWSSYGQNVQSEKTKTRAPHLFCKHQITIVLTLWFGRHSWRLTLGVWVFVCFCYVCD